jgi:hypothetical protein
MVHYPKALMRKATESLVSSPDLEMFRQVSEDMRIWTQNHLTSAAMLQYAFEVSKIPVINKVLFLDERLATQPDYLSVMTLISLKQLFGSKCHVPWKADYLYRGWGGDHNSLYGLGFGYSQVLAEDNRSDMEYQAADPQNYFRNDFDSYDLIVVGSAIRNRMLTNFVHSLSGPAKLYFVGEDQPMSRSERSWLRSLNGNVFVREIY